jgi:hypothetical protein
MPMLRAASLLEAGLHLLQRSRPLRGKAITSDDTARHQSGEMTANSDRLSACLAKGRVTRTEVSGSFPRNWRCS